jgi:hypothetical protein
MLQIPGDIFLDYDKDNWLTLSLTYSTGLPVNGIYYDSFSKSLYGTPSLEK